MFTLTFLFIMTQKGKQNWKSTISNLPFIAFSAPSCQSLGFQLMACCLAVAICWTASNFGMTGRPPV